MNHVYSNRVTDKWRTQSFCSICSLFLMCCSFYRIVFGVYLNPIEGNIGLWSGDTHFSTCFKNKSEDQIDGTVKWFNPEGEEIKESMMSSPYIGRSEENAVKLFFFNVKKSDSGQYKCSLRTNDGKEVSSAAFNLHVYKSIERLAAKDSYSASLGDTLSLTCIVRFDKFGTDSQITWAYNNSKILFTDNSKFANDTTRTENSDSLKIKSTLIIRNLSLDNEGDYICRAATVNKQVSSIKFYTLSVKVDYGPYFENTSRYIWIPANENADGKPIIVNIPCIVKAYPPVNSFKWQTGDGMVVESGKLQNRSHISTTENKSILTLRYANLDDIKSNFKNYHNINMNKFKCHVVKQNIHNETTFELKIGHLPVAPLIMNTQYYNGKLILMLNETNQEPPVDLYHLVISASNHFYFNDSNKNVMNNTYELQVDIPSGQHEMVIYAHNPVGWSQERESYSLAVVSHTLILKPTTALFMILTILSTILSSRFF